LETKQNKNLYNWWTNETLEIFLFWTLIHKGVFSSP